MNDNIEVALRRGTSYLMTQSHNTGYFEGELSSNAFPTCAYAWVQFALGKVPDEALIQWLPAQAEREWHLES